MMIALIIPFYNAEPYLKRCLDSIAGPFEVIMIDDGSTDGGADLVDNYDNQGYMIYLIKLGERRGVSCARNTGIEKALELEADYITFLDVDDFMLPDAYDQLVTAIKEEPREKMIQLNHRRRQANGYDYIKFYNKQGTYSLEKLPDFWVGVWNKVYKASLLEDIRFIPGLDHGEDELFNLECLSKARRIYCSDRIHMVHCFDNPQSLSKTVTPKDLIAEQHALNNFMLRHKEDIELLEAVRQRQAYLWDNKVYKSTFGGK